LHRNIQTKDSRCSIPRPRFRIVSLGRLMHGTVNRAERNGEEGNDTAVLLLAEHDKRKLILQRSTRLA